MGVLERDPEATATTLARWLQQVMARVHRVDIGRSTDALTYYELFAGLRFTVIMLRVGRLLADMGLVPPDFARDNLISRALADLLDRAQDRQKL